MATLRDNLIRLSKSFLEALQFEAETPQRQISIKSELQSLLLLDEEQDEDVIKDKFILACALLSSSISSTYHHLSKVPRNLALEAGASFKTLPNPNSEAMRRVILLLKDKITETSIKGDEISAACARAPVEHAILAANQFRWLVTEVKGEQLGRLTQVIIPCGLSSLDHWSPEVKQQGMIAFVHLASNVNASSLHLYEDAILDACCSNLAAADEIWESAVEATVSVVTIIRNPRSHWLEKLMSEMITHLERQPGNRDRRIGWLKFVDPMMEKMGLLLLSHFKRLFPLFFVWIRSGDEETVLLSLQRVRTAIRVTWMRHVSHVGRLVDELALLNKEAAVGQTIRDQIASLISVLRRCENPRFEEAWLANRASFAL